MSAKTGEVESVDRSGRGSKEFRLNREKIERGGVPEKYYRILPFVPGDRVLEIGAAEGVLSLLLSEKKQRVVALDHQQERCDDAIALRSKWSAAGFDVDRLEVECGDIRDRSDLLEGMDTLLAVRCIYYLREDIVPLFERFGEHFEHIVLVGNGYRTRRWFDGRGQPRPDKYAYDWYATLDGMWSLLERSGHEIVHAVPDGDPIVVSRRSGAPR